MTHSFSIGQLEDEIAQLHQRLQTARDGMKSATRYSSPGRFEKSVLTTYRTTLNAIADCSKFESKLLADAIHEKLPRELRDMT